MKNIVPNQTDSMRVKPSASPLSIGEVALASGVITKRDLEMAHASAELELVTAQEADVVVFHPSLFCQVALPYRDPGHDVPDWVRNSGSVMLTIQPYVETERVPDSTPQRLRPPGGVVKRYRHAYGIIPRAFLTWAATQVVTNSPDLDSHTLNLGHSMSAFLRKMGVEGATGGARGSITRFRNQIKALAGSSISVTQEGGDENTGYWLHEGMKFASRTFLAWAPQDDHYQEGGLFPSTLTLTTEMYKSMRESAVPIDLRAIRALRAYGSEGSSGGAFTFDIYCWLAYRLHALTKPTLVTWQQLSDQFGSQYKRLRAFKENLLKQLPAVQAAYPAAKWVVRDNGLLLYPSPPPVPERDKIPRSRPRQIETK